MFVMLTPAASNDPTGAHDAHPKFAMNRSYVLMRCVFAKWAGKVFAPLIKPSSLSSTKLGNNLCLKTLLCEHQFSGFLLSIRNRAILHVYGSRLYYRKTTIAVRTCLCWLNHTLPKIHVQSIYLCHVFLGVCIGGALVVVFMRFCVALFDYKKALSQNTSICTRILSYIIVNRLVCKNFETCLEKSTNPSPTNKCTGLVLCKQLR